MMLIELQRRNDIPRNVLTRMFLLGAGYTVDGAIGAFKQRYGYEPTEGWRVGNVLYVKVEVRE